eukprot:Mrub_09774.p1 GENE.Mrub_09774~~Mrub_09774.p1  ORF type:complete len:218 (-),score=32.16 Mrub_09774:74-703(-)
MEYNESNKTITLKSKDGQIILNKLKSLGKSVMHDKITKYWKHQRHNTFCGLASASIILGTIENKEIDENEIITLAKISPEKESELRIKGLTMGFLNEGILNKIDNLKLTQIYYSDELNWEQFRQILIESLESNSYVLLNFNLDVNLGGLGIGHVSPISAYSDEYDMFLVMDVWYNIEPLWVNSKCLYESTTAIDSDSNRSRGFIVIKIY